MKAWQRSLFSGSMWLLWLPECPWRVTWLPTNTSASSVGSVEPEAQLLILRLERQQFSTFSGLLDLHLAICPALLSGNMSYYDIDSILTDAEVRFSLFYALKRSSQHSADNRHWPCSRKSHVLSSSTSPTWDTSTTTQATLSNLAQKFHCPSG